MSRIKEYYHDDIEQQQREFTKIIRESTLPEGYVEYQFLAAFDALCREVGGFKSGKEKALEIIKERAPQ